MTIEEAIAVCKAAGYSVRPPSKRQRNTSGKYSETNPFNHPYPHAKLRNITLTSITRLNKGGEGPGNHRHHLIGNNDPRNYMLSGRVPA